MPLKGATLKVLGPERDIDFYYLGDEGDPDLRSELRQALGFIDTSLPPVSDAVPATPPMPAESRSGGFSSAALAHAVHRAGVCRSRRQGLQQHQRGAVDRVEKQAAAVRRRRRMGRRLQGGNQGQLFLERDVESAQGASQGPARLLQDRTPWQRQRDTLGIERRGKERRTARHPQRDPAGRIQGQGEGHRVNPSRQLPDDPALRPAGRDRQPNCQQENLLDRVQERRHQNLGRSEICRLRAVRRLANRSRCEPTSNASWIRTRDSSTSRSKREARRVHRPGGTR